MLLRIAKCLHTGAGPLGLLLPHVRGQSYPAEAATWRARRISQQPYLARGQTSVGGPVRLSPGKPPADRNCMNEPDKTSSNYRVMSKPILPVTRFGEACIWQQVTNTQTIRGTGRPYILPRVRESLWLSRVEDCNPQGSSCTPRPCICSFCQA